MYHYLTEQIAYLNQRFSFVYTNFGCEMMGYLVLTALPAVFTLQCAILCVAIVDPEHTPIIPAPAHIATVIGELTRTHTKNMRIFREFKNSDMACKKVITKLVNKVYYHLLKIRYKCYANISYLEKITHLWTEYGTITELEV